MSAPCAGQPGERDFFEYVAESYRFFLAADNARCEEVDAPKVAQFDERSEAVRQELTTLQQVRTVFRSDPMWAHIVQPACFGCAVQVSNRRQSGLSC